LGVAAAKFGSNDFAVMDASRNIVAECYADIRHHGEGARDEAKANARLYAGASDLLEASQLADCGCSLHERESGHRIGCWMPALSAAIAKATGATQ
jgi:hypothetical protein